MLPVLPVADTKWWTHESFRGVPLPQILAARDFGQVFAFLKSRGWSVGAIAAVTRVQEARVREIMAGRRKVTSYEVIERIVTGLSIDRATCGIGTAAATCQCATTTPDASITELMAHAENLKPDGLALLMAHTDHIRDLSHSLGAAAALTALGAHLETLARLRSFSVSTARRRDVAKLFHDAACLAGCLSGSIGDDTAAWRHHEAAKDAAREAECTAALAHTLSQQSRILASGGHAAAQRRLDAQIKHLNAGAVLPEVSRGEEITHYHGRLYQRARLGVAVQLGDGGVQPRELGVGFGVGDGQQALSERVVEVVDGRRAAVFVEEVRHRLGQKRQAAAQHDGLFPWIVQMPQERQQREPPVLVRNGQILGVA
nr:hypothetical protein [Stackebrandtia nassauensis]